jgi:predicted transposase YbfD/YdcC
MPYQNETAEKKFQVFSDIFSTLADPRRITKGNLRYTLEEVLFLTISACISGANGWTAIEAFGHSKLDWLRKFHAFENGVPSHDAISDLFAVLCPKAFGQCFMDWVNSIHDITKGLVVALDGKTVRGFANTDKKASLHIVSAYVSLNRITLGQIAVDEKSNEITAIPKLLDLLTLNGCIITIDAMGCQKEIAKKICEKKADYILMVKDNQPELKEQVLKVFKLGNQIKTATDVTAGNGRVETRTCHLTNALDFLDVKGDWENLKSIVKINSVRYCKKTAKTSTEERFYITSLDNNPEQLNSAIRSHWGIENNLHWELDVLFREDGQLKRIGNSAENFNIISKIALGIIDNDKSVKNSKPNKRLMAACNDTYREKLLKC